MISALVLLYCRLRNLALVTGFAVFLISSLNSTASGVEVYGTTSFDLRSYDFSVPSATLIGSHGFANPCCGGSRLGALSFAANGGLYGTDQFGNLFEVDQGTGLARLVGNTGIGNIEGLDLWGDDLLAVDFASKPTIFAISTADASSRSVVTADRFTGAALDLAVADNVAYITTISDGVTSDASKTFLYQMDLLSGSTTLIGEIEFTSVFALAVVSDNTLYGSAINGEILRIDRVTGDAFVVGYADQAVDFATAPVPEPSGIAYLAIGIVCLIVASGRRKYKGRCG